MLVFFFIFLSYFADGFLMCKQRRWVFAQEIGCTKFVHTVFLFKILNVQSKIALGFCTQNRCTVHYVHRCTEKNRPCTEAYLFGYRVWWCHALESIKYHIFVQKFDSVPHFKLSIIYKIISESVSQLHLQSEKHSVHCLFGNCCTRIW